MRCFAAVLFLLFFFPLLSYPRDLLLCRPTESHLVCLLGRQNCTPKQACHTVHICRSAGPAPGRDGLQGWLCYEKVFKMSVWP